MSVWYFCNSSSIHRQTLTTNQKEEPNMLTWVGDQFQQWLESLRTGDVSFSWISKARANILNYATEMCQWGEKTAWQKQQKKILISERHRFINKCQNCGWISRERLKRRSFHVTHPAHLPDSTEFFPVVLSHLLSSAQHSEAQGTRPADLTIRNVLPNILLSFVSAHFHALAFMNFARQP